MEVVIIIVSFNNLGISKKRSTGTGVTGFSWRQWQVQVHEVFKDRRKDPFKQVSPSGGENYDYNCLVALGVHPTFVHFPLEIQPYVFMMHPRYTHALIYHFTSHSSRSKSSIRVFPLSSITLTFHFQVRPY